MSNKKSYLMKQNLFFYLTIFFIGISFCQEKSMNYIVFKSAINDTENVLNSNTISKLQSRITQIATNNGFSAVENTHDFIVSVDFHIYDTNKITGFKKNTVINGELFLTLSNANSNVQYSSLTYKISGSGNNLNLAISNAINHIKPNDVVFAEFFLKAKKKIFNYYLNNCNNIIAENKNKYIQQKYQEVINSLSIIPLNIVSCRDEVKQLLKDSFLKLQNKNCEKLLLKGESEIALKNYNKALNTFGYIDPESKCYSKALQQIKHIENEIDKEILRDWNFKLEKYSDEKELEKYRIKMIKEISKAYYSQDYPDTNLDLIIVK